MRTRKHSNGSLSMRVLQTVFGVFHHFELARELQRRGHLDSLYSTWPWARLQREGLPHSKVKTFPWVHTPEYLLSRLPLDFGWLRDPLGYANALSFDRWTVKQLRRQLHRRPVPDVLIGISGSSLRAGEFVQQHGGLFLCDRGSTHQRFQERLVREEYARWGVEQQPSDERDTLREERIYAQADAITVPSSFAARSFAAMGVPAAKVHTIPYGVRLEHFAPTGEPPRNEFVVLFAGAVGLRKGFPYLLEAFAALQHPRKRLDVVGAVQSDMRDVLRRLPQQHVHFHGPLSQSELARRMSRSHVLVLPSIEEGLALVQAQALACGCPVLCSENTGGDDLFTDGVEGFIVSIRNARELGQRLRQLADDPAMQERMRAAGLERVQSLGGWSEYGDAWERLLFKLRTPAPIAAERILRPQSAPPRGGHLRQPAH